MPCTRTAPGSRKQEALIIAAACFAALLIIRLACLFKPLMLLLMEPVPSWLAGVWGVIMLNVGRIWGVLSKTTDGER